MRINRIAFVIAITKRDMKIKDLAEKTGLTRATISSVKNGKSCSDDTAKKLVAVLGNDILQEPEK